jgi:hypothetical protein
LSSTLPGREEYLGACPLMEFGALSSRRVTLFLHGWEEEEEEEEES